MVGRDLQGGEGGNRTPAMSGDGDAVAGVGRVTVAGGERLAQYPGGGRVSAR